MKKIYCFLLVILCIGCSNNKLENDYIKEKTMIDLNDMSIEEIRTYAQDNNLELEIKEDYSNEEEGKVIFQSISADTVINDGDTLTVTLSLGRLSDDTYIEYEVNELGKVPIMMYHGIHNKEANYIGGNVDVDGYQRTAEAFRNDLEFYYQNGYRMIRLEDFINGQIDVPLGKSPIILTFDDGLENNIKVTGLDENGNIEIDPNSAVGILNEFKNKYPDFNVTATFFVTGALFNQKEYNEQILNYLIDNGYDIGNHSYNHADFTKISTTEANKQIGSVYDLLDTIIPNKYVNIVALPYGSPYNKNHENYKYILNSTYNDKEYSTISTLRVGWESNESPFDKDFDAMFLKRIRAYDNNGEDFDIEMNFKILETKKYISDGNVNNIVIPSDKLDEINSEYTNIITYEK